MYCFLMTVWCHSWVSSRVTFWRHLQLHWCGLLCAEVTQKTRGKPCMFLSRSSGKWNGLLQMNFLFGPSNNVTMGPMRCLLALKASSFTFPPVLHNHETVWNGWQASSAWLTIPPLPLTYLWSLNIKLFLWCCSKVTRKLSEMDASFPLILLEEHCRKFTLHFIDETKI